MNKSLLTIYRALYRNTALCGARTRHDRGAEEGAAAGGPSGRATRSYVGGAIGAATGTVGGILGRRGAAPVSRVRHT